MRSPGEPTCVKMGIWEGIPPINDWELEEYDVRILPFQNEDLQFGSLQEMQNVGDDSLAEAPEMHKFGSNYAFDNTLFVRRR